MQPDPLYDLQVAPSGLIHGNPRHLRVERHGNVVDLRCTDRTLLQPAEHVIGSSIQAHLCADTAGDAQCFHRPDEGVALERLQHARKKRLAATARLSDRHACIPGTLPEKSVSLALPVDDLPIDVPQHRQPNARILLIPHPPRGRPQPVTERPADIFDKSQSRRCPECDVLTRGRASSLAHRLSPRWKFHPEVLAVIPAQTPEHIVVRRSAAHAEQVNHVRVGARRIHHHQRPFVHLRASRIRPFSGCADGLHSGRPPVEPQAARGEFLSLPVDANGRMAGGVLLPTVHFLVCKRRWIPQIARQVVPERDQVDRQFVPVTVPAAALSVIQYQVLP